MSHGCHGAQFTGTRTLGVRFRHMDAITAINQRTSIRRFRADPVSRETIQRLLDCAVRA
ncbi:MAG: nitroreductase family protein, partial [Gemmatimonadales bacterium]